MSAGRQRWCSGAAGALAMAMSVHAQVTPIEPFSGEFTESFPVGTGYPHCVVAGVFSGRGQLCTFDMATGAPTNGAHITASWGYSCVIFPHLPGTRLFGSNEGAAVYTFEVPIRRFGGYFGTNLDLVIAGGGGTATFFDAANGVIGQAPIPIATCEVWEWHGWELAVPARRVRIASSAMGGAFLMMDAMVCDTAPGGSACYPNCDQSTVEPILNIDDFTCFINEFAAGQSLPHAEQVVHYANCDGSTVAPALNIDDFTCFINAFAGGCP